VDPDEKDKNEAFADALKEANLDHSKYGSVAIVNMAATWKPDIIIEALLKSKQKKFPNAVYVKDKKKVLVKEWGLADDESDVMVFNAEGKLIYLKEGKLSKEEIKRVINLIKSEIK
jgi:predicted transcriptional regulator